MLYCEFVADRVAPALTQILWRGLMLQDLVNSRKNCQLCMDQDPGAIVNGSSFDFDPNVVSHWSQWLGYTSPRILVVGQDFSDRGYFERNRGADDPNSETNKNLFMLLHAAGLSPKPAPQPDLETPVYLTNSILCLKVPPMKKAIKPRWVKNCAVNHLRPLVHKLNPKVIVPMGKQAWLAVRTAFALEGLPEGIVSVVGETLKIGEIYIVPVVHCSKLGQGTRNWEKQLDDWKRIGEVLRSLN